MMNEVFGNCFGVAMTPWKLIGLAVGAARLVKGGPA